MTKKDYLYSTSLGQSLAEKSFSSEEDFVDLQELPRLPKNNSSAVITTVLNCIILQNIQKYSIRLKCIF